MNTINFQKLATRLLIVSIIIVLVSLALRVTNFGYIDFGSLSGEGIILVDGKQVNDSKVRVKGGDHQVVIFNKSTTNYADVITVGRLKTVKPDISKSSPEQIAVQTLDGWKWGITEQELRSVRQIDNFIVGAVSQGSASPFVLEYKDGWHVLYFENENFVSNRTFIPDSILPIVQEIEANYADR